MWTDSSCLMKMKSQEGELVREISKLQAMVLDLRAGFSRALLELNQIQLGDTELQSQLEETRHGCNKRALHLETLVLSLREELEEIRCQIHQLCDEQLKAEQTSSGAVTQCDSAAGCSGLKNGINVNGISEVSGGVATPPLCSVGGALLLHCYLQGLWAGHRSVGELPCTQVSPRGVELQTHTLQGGARRVATSLMRSERDYVSALVQIYDKYKSPSTACSHAELHKAFARLVDQMLQCHLTFRNLLEERLGSEQESSEVGDAFAKLTGQDSSAFCDAYLGYTATLAAILATEFSRENPDKPQNTQEEERERFRLLSLLLAPVSRIHTYLNTIHLLLSCSGCAHSDWRSLQETEQLLQNLCTRCHMILEREGRWGERAGTTNSLSGRFHPESPHCGRSAFTKYRANTRVSTANCYTLTGVPSNGHLAVPRPLLPPTGILRNSRERVCEQLASGGWPDSMWNSRVGECHPMPLCMPAARRPQQLFLNPGVPTVAGEVQGAAAQNQKSPLGLVERLCGSPGPDGVCRTDLYSLPQHVDGADTDGDVGDASVFDYSSVTTCSPDDTLELREGGGEDSREDEDDDDEDSEIPVLLKPSYAHKHSSASTGSSLREGSVCTRWQIPRAAPLPAEVGVLGSGTGHRSTKSLRRIPAGVFRPIWGAPYRQGGSAPAKETIVSFSKTTQIINSQRQAESSRSTCRGVCSGSPVGAQREEGIWNESEDSEEPCSTV